MYWAVRQICMAKHLRSLRWWGGGFVRPRREKTNTTDDFHYCVLPFSTHPITARINWLSYLSAKGPTQGLPALLRTTCTLSFFRACLLFMCKTILAFLRGCNTFVRFKVATLKRRPFVAGDTGCNWDLYPPVPPPLPRLAFSLLSSGRDLGRMWHFAEYVWWEWIMLFRFIMALYFSAGSFLRCPSGPGGETWGGCSKAQTAYIFHDVHAVLLGGSAEMLCFLSL